MIRSRAEGDGEVGQLVSRAGEESSAGRLVVSVRVRVRAAALEVAANIMSTWFS
jgi:hypothetical protein